VKSYIYIASEAPLLVSMVSIFLVNHMQ
jgi:hypothetical protein